MYETVGNFCGAPGWTVIQQMPERKAIVLAKSNIKIAHKFSTGALHRTPRTAPLVSRWAPDTCRPPHRQDGGSAILRPRLGTRTRTRCGIQWSWARPRVLFTRRNCCRPTTAATRCGSRSSAISSQLLCRGASSSCLPTSGRTAPRLCLPNRLQLRTCSRCAPRRPPLAPLLQQRRGHLPTHTVRQLQLACGTRWQRRARHSCRTGTTAAGAEELGTCREDGNACEVPGCLRALYVHHELRSPAVHVSDSSSFYTMQGPGCV
jgi:hypothetical protein